MYSGRYQLPAASCLLPAAAAAAAAAAATAAAAAAVIATAASLPEGAPRGRLASASVPRARPERSSYARTHGQAVLCRFVVPE